MSAHPQPSRVALVTGGSKGIGYACADEFAAQGYRVLICSRDSDEAERAAAQLSRDVGQVRGVAADLSSPTVGSDLVDTCIEMFGRLDCLVNNAGVFQSTSMVDMTANSWDATLHTNLRGVALLSGAAARVMDAGASIINLSSINGIASEADFAAYNASKAGIISLTQTCAIEWARQGIRVNCVAPGWTYTPMSAPWIGGISQESVDRMIPMGRIGTPADIAQVVMFMASPAAGYVTGQTLTVDGGMLIRQPML